MNFLRIFLLVAIAISLTLTLESCGRIGFELIEPITDTDMGSTDTDTDTDTDTNTDTDEDPQSGNCNDSIDNDSDGFTDSADSSCPQHRMSITVDSTKVSPIDRTDLTNFPVFLETTNSALKASTNHVNNSAGDDIFVGDTHGRPIDFELQYYTSSNGSIGLWFRVDTLSASTDTVYYLYYGAAIDMPSFENSDDTWYQSYRGVWHFDEDPGGGADAMVDSSGSGAHGTADDGLAARSPVNGVINKALDFGSSPMQLAVNAGTYSQFTMSGWLYLPDQSRRWDSIIGYNNEWLICTEITNNGARRQIGVWDGAEVGLLDHGANFPFDAWFHFAMIMQQSTLDTYLDGVAGNTHIPQTKSPLNFDIVGKNAFGGEDFYGYMDEMRIMDSPQSRDWIRTEYLNQSNPETFCILGKEENL